jgi:hypothetical protein
MTLTPGLRKLALTVHVISSVGWIGGVAAFLALAIAGLLSPDPQIVSASYLAMDLSYRSVVVPLGLASLATGLVSSLATEWGLFRYDWILAKLFLTAPAIILMLVHLQPVAHVAGMAAASVLSSDDVFGLRMQLVAYAIVALAALLAATALSTYKPRGRSLSRMGKLRGLSIAQPQTPAAAIGERSSTGFKIFFAVLGATLVALAVTHVSGLHGP